ncbi:MAG: hypothetical protein AAB731_01295 [Patescibacteria group bacterium]
MTTTDDHFRLLILPYGEIDEEVLRQTADIIQTHLGLRTSVLPAVKIQKRILVGPDTADTEKLISQVSDIARVYGQLVLGIIAADLILPQQNQLLDGYAEVDGAAAIITLAELPRDKRGAPAPLDLKNLILHELGHVLGNNDCPEHCLMSEKRGLYASEISFCARCRGRMERALTHWRAR